MYIRCTNCRQIKFCTNFPALADDLDVFQEFDSWVLWNCILGHSYDNREENYPGLSPWCRVCLIEFYHQHINNATKNIPIMRTIISIFGEQVPENSGPLRWDQTPNFSGFLIPRDPESYKYQFPTTKGAKFSVLRNLGPVLRTVGKPGRPKKSNTSKGEPKIPMVAKSSIPEISWEPIPLESVFENMNGIQN